MKTIRQWLKQAFNWIDTYGWAIFAFLLGVGAGLIVVAIDISSRDFTIAVVTAIGTVGAAGAALWTTQVSRRALTKQLDREQELKQPNLVLSSIGIEVKEFDYKEYDRFYNNPAGRYVCTFRLDAQLTNLGEFPIYIKKISTSLPHRQFIHLIKVGTDDEYDERGFLIPPNESVRRALEFSSLIPTYKETIEGPITIFFQYGPTAKKLHSLELQVDVLTYDSDHALEGELNIRNDDEFYKKDFSLGYNYDRRMRGEYEET